jgi:hypothetical protein
VRIDRSAAEPDRVAGDRLRARDEGQRLDVEIVWQNEGPSSNSD